ncbi:MAG: SusD/RagB family nutrient-binding outer membrane lipoprotein [Cytophagales bacterium]|nr:SusD/RagB family nutrient-binding outer membrane lipoprotein [Cytophagales bacterium]
MKSANIIKVLSIIVLITFGCTDNFEDINTNPNAQAVGSNEGLLLGAQISAARELLDNVGGNNHGLSKWCQYYTEALEDHNDFVKVNPREDYNDFWNYHTFVTSTLPVIERILSNTEETPHANYRAIAFVMKAWVFQTMTDQWGPIPFHDAIKGEVAEDPKYNKPKFNSQEEIYVSTMAYLETANDLFDLSDVPESRIVAPSDAYGGGDILLWKKFANSLRARILLRMSDINESVSRAGLQELFGDPAKYPVFESNDDNFGITWEDATGSYSDPMAKYLNDNGYTPNVVSGFVNILGDRLDPRMKKLVGPANDYEVPTFVGIPPAFEADNPSGFTGMTRDSISQVSTAFAEVQQRPIMTYAELLFIKAEAAKKGFTVGVTAKEAYDNAILADMERLGVESDEADNYLLHPKVVYDDAMGLELIITQRYIAQFGQSINSFAMIRRTGYPELDYFTIGLHKDNGYPVRIGYPEMMESFNGENFREATNGVTIIQKVFGDKLWFASNAPDVKMVPTLQTGPVTYSF